MSKITKIQDLEKELWAAADELRGNLSAEEYMHVIIGILFLKQISKKHDEATKAIKYQFPNNWEDKINDIDRLSMYGCSFVVPSKSLWSYVSSFATKYEIGQVLDDAFRYIEKENSSLVGLFNKNYSRESLDKTKLGRVVSIFSNLEIKEEEDLIGRVYEYFLGQFFLKRGQKGGEFYTPKSIVSLMVNILDPREGKIYDPCCGTGGMFIQAKQHLEELNISIDKLIVYGQEYTDNTWKIGRINLLIQGFDGGNVNFGNKSADTFSNDLHKDLKVDYVLANPPFNLKVWSNEAREKREWKYGMPPKGNANYAWLQHIVEKLNKNGKAAVVLANGSLTSNTKEEKIIRQKMIEDNIVSTIISLPDKLFYTTGIPACIWIFDRNKTNKNVLFIEAYELGKLIPGQKKNKEISKENSEYITSIYNNFSDGKEINIPGIAKSITFDEMKENDFSLLPGAYIEIKEEEQKSKDEIKKELKQNIEELLKLFDETKELEKDIKEAIKKIELD